MKNQSNMDTAEKGVKIFVYIMKGLNSMNEYNCKMYVVDEMMGRGKSWAAINYMNSHDDQKFLYITPYLDELTNRIIPNCPDKNFVMPEAKRYGTKTRHLKQLLNKGRNVASTHALFRLFDEETIDICRNQNYTLIMDEVSEVVEQYNISDDDLHTLMEKYVDVDNETNLLVWRQNRSNYNGKFVNEKRLCNMGCLGKYGDDVMMWLFPVQAFNAFPKVYILTYMFESQIQKYYYDFHKLRYSYLYVVGDSTDTYKFSTTPDISNNNVEIKNLIHIIDNEKLNNIGDMYYDLSKSWYARNCQSGNFAIKKLKDNMFNFFHNIMHSPTSNNLWTCFKDYKSNISGKGYAKGFIPSNSRATNNYRNRTAVAYPINRFMHTYIKNFFLNNNINVNEDGYALSEMLQWIWRSAIRDGKEIWIYIPSSRMRKLLTDWIESVREK